MSAYVCNDLMFQIFERLPPKSIIRFRSLSKYCHSRLFSPEFLHAHRLRCSKNPPKVIIRHVIDPSPKYNKPREIYTLHQGDQLLLDPMSGSGVEFPYHLDPSMGSVIGSYNGILCLYNDTNISLWNFSIRRKLIVPRHPPLKPSTYTWLVLGFGFDPITDDYNIVAISNSSAFIYSLKTDSWSAIPSPSAWLSEDSYVRPKASSFLINGILHWVGYGDLSIESTDKTRCCCFILTFNLRSRVCGYILLPDSWIVEQVTTINGCLAVVHPQNNGLWDDNYSWIRVMKEYGNVESWSAHCKVKRDWVHGISVYQPVINGDILAYYREGSKVYNTRTRLTKCLGFGPDCVKVEMDPYVESLELVDKERATTCGKTVFSWTEKE